MFEVIVENSVLIITGSIITGLISAFVLQFKKFKALQEAILALNHDRLYQACSFYILTKEIEVEELRNLGYLYNGYHALGGNGTGTELYEKCKQLPVVEHRTRWHQFYTGEGGNEDE